MLSLRTYLIAATVAALPTSACGARTGLIQPDIARVVDAAIDAVQVVNDVPVVTMVECMTDHDCDDGIACTDDHCDPTLSRCTRVTHDSACNDHLFCNGVERCDVSVGCVAGSEPCHDAVACTVDSCHEDSDRCVETPSDDLCPISNRCDPIRGCLPRVLAHGPAGLYEVELPAGRIRSIAPLVRGLTDIALDPNRVLYGISHTDLYSINATTGASMLISTVGTDFTALDSSPDGTLYGAAADSVYQLDVQTGEGTVVGHFPAGLVASGDIAFLRGRFLATAVVPPGQADDLVEFDLAANTSHSLGSIGSRCVWGLAAFSDQLYGLTCEGKVLTLDPATGAGTILTTSPVTFYGATAR